MLDNAPETLQYLMGIHPIQMAQSQALAQAAQGDTQGLAGGDADEPPNQPGQPSSEPEAAAPVIAPPPSRHEPMPLNVAGDESQPETVDVEDKPSQIAKPREEMGPPVPPEIAAKEDAPDLNAPSQSQASIANISGLIPASVRPISADQDRINQDHAREATDQAEIDRLNRAGSGVNQFMHRHRFLGPLVKGLTVAGEAIAPGVAALVPGTDVHHNVLVNQARGRVQQDQGDTATHQRIADNEALDESRRENARSQDELRHIHAIGVGEKFIAGSEKEDANSPTGYVAQNFNGEWKPYTPPASYRENSGEKTAAQMAERGKQADKLGLQGDERKFYIANGKLREPNPNQPQVDEDRKARLQRQKEHDEDTRMNHYQVAHQRWTEHKSAIEKDQEQGYAKIENDWRKKYGDVLDKKDTDPEKQVAVAELERQKKLLQDSITQRFTELGPEPGLPKEQPAAAQSSTDIEQPIASVRAYSNDGTPAQTRTGVDAQGRKTIEIATKQGGGKQAKPGDVIGPAPAGSQEGRTGKLADGTKVVVKNGKIVAQ